MVIKIGDRTIGGPGTREARISALAATLVVQYLMCPSPELRAMTRNEFYNYCHKQAAEVVDRAIREEEANAN